MKVPSIPLKVITYRPVSWLLTFVLPGVASMACEPVVTSGPDKFLGTELRSFSRIKA
jgi:hypothetical protein